MRRFEYTPPKSDRFNYLICAIHAGVEHGTAAIARAIHAMDPTTTGLFIDWDPVHVTSTAYFHPVFDTVVRHYNSVVSIHGMDGYGRQVFVGGRNLPLVRSIRGALGAHTPPPAHLAGTHPLNVANRGASGVGVQVEIDVSILQNS
jgi:phage replication-related protein YjqB (UPF0714/DUF867 family)